MIDEVQVRALLREAEAATISAGHQWRVDLAGPASAADLAELEKSVRWPLPPSYRSFLSLHDGFYLQAGTSDSWRLTVLSARDALAYSSGIQEQRTRDDCPLIWFGLWAESDLIVLNSAFAQGGESAVLVGYHDDSGCVGLESFIVAPSFDVFLTSMLENIIAGNKYGPCYWLNDVRFALADE
jgi:hypothetical protein